MPLTDRTWQRHANPWSGWSRLLTTPLVYVPIWHRSWRQAIPVAAWFWLNPSLFPPPADDRAWITRVVLGERLWTRRPARDPSTLLNALVGIFFVPAAHAAWGRHFWRLVAFGGFSLLCKLWFMDRMVVLYERRPAGGDTRP
jgi:hypothetical protein